MKGHGKEMPEFLALIKGRTFPYCVDTHQTVLTKYGMIVMLEKASGPILKGTSSPSTSGTHLESTT
jgi:hypothetical protein